MRDAFITYRWFIYLFFALILSACGSAGMDENYAEEGEAAAEENSVQAAEYTEEEIENEDSYLVKKWKNKAKQQLESVEDLMMILKDSTLDPAFRFEIEKELNLLYPKKDSMLVDLMSENIQFKNFKALNVENGDTMSLLFKNHKELLKAKFIVVFEAKEFGNTTEMVERLQILSIQREE